VDALVALVDTYVTGIDIIGIVIISIAVKFFFYHFGLRLKIHCFVFVLLRPTGLCFVLWHTLTFPPLLYSKFVFSFSFFRLELIFPN